MHLALCDDESAELARIRAFLEQYCVMRPDIELTVNSFTTGSALLEHMRIKSAFDIYLLDVIMPGENGIELGLDIRRLDQGGHIIYLTASPDFAVDSYRTRATGYLLKPLEKDRLFALLDGLAEQWLQQRRSFVTIKTREGLQRVPLHTIVYGELVDRCVQYHLSNGSEIEGMSLRGSFQNAVQPLLEHNRFVLCTKSFFVNLSFVKRIDSSGLQLSGGGILPLSRQLRREVTDQWLDYYLEGRE